jgi:peptidoglycan/LPS O-acetylase OafA/YrhL
MIHHAEERVRELDGIRGLAILLILIIHFLKRADHFTGNAILLGLTQLSGINWIGVDIFFVLSGFLITGILLRTKDHPHYFRNFYARRILRIFPLYYLFIIPMLIILPLIDPDRGAETQSVWYAFIFYLQNWTHITGPEPSLYFTILWSLAIEEQFYLIWPAVVYFLDRRKLAWAALGMIAVSLITRIVMVNTLVGVIAVQRFFYYASFIRFEGMAVGALIALAFEHKGAWMDRIKRYALPAFVIAVIAFGLMIIGRKPYPVSDNFILSVWGYSAVAFASGALIALMSSLNEGSIPRRIFASRFMTFFGKYSYAMYILHYPIALALWEYLLTFKRQNATMWLIFMSSAITLTIIASLLSWNLLEKRMLRLKKYFE